MRIEETFVLLIVILLLPLITPVIAGSDEKNVTINVTVNPITEITVLPTSLNWTQDPATEGTPFEVTIKNTGTTNITDLFVYPWTIEDEATRPYGTGDPQAYSATGVIVISDKEGSDTYYYWAGRLEWNWTEDVPNKVVPSGTTAWGFYKNISKEYFWSLTPNQTTTYCNDTGAELRIDPDVDDGTSSTRDTTDPSGVAGTLNAKPNWGLFTFTSGPWQNMCVAAYYDCTKIYIYKYDKRQTSGTPKTYGYPFGDCGDSKKLYPTETTVFPPGDITRVNVNAWTPKGIPAGILKIGTLTFVGFS